MDAIEKNWVDKTYAAILTVQRHLGIKGEDKQEFAKLANWIYKTDINSLLFMPKGWTRAKDSAHDFAEFVATLYSHMCGDGVMHIIETDLYGSFITFGNDEGLLDSYEKMLDAFIERNGASCTKPNFILTHQNVDRFIEQIELYVGKDAEAA